MSNVTLILQRGEETRRVSVSFGLNPWKSAKMVKKIRRFQKDGWTLIHCEGDNAMAQFIRDDLRERTNDPTYEPSIRSMIDVSASTMDSPKEQLAKKWEWFSRKLSTKK